jgi:hypothetical protein
MKPKYAIAIAGATVLVVVVIALITIMLVVRGGVADGHPKDLLGKWSSEYRGGRVVLTLRADGSYEEQLARFPTLPDRTLDGSWVVDSGRLLLEPCVLVDYTKNGREYRTWASEEINVRPGFWGGVIMYDTEDLSFQRVSPAKQ